MPKYILFLLSEYYYEIVRERKDEIGANSEHRTSGTRILVAGVTEEGVVAEEEKAETLLITDSPRTAGRYLDAGWYVVPLYHERNRGMEFPAMRYGIEDVFALEGRTYEEVYRRLAGLPWDILETERLWVRESTVRDVEEFYRIYQDPFITRYMENLFPEKEAEQAYMKAYIDQIYGFYGYGLWSVLLKESGQVIGRAGLSVREGYELPELGFVIGTDCQGKGYGFEVCKAILEYAAEELGFKKVQALVREGNQVSKRLLAKLGFSYEKKVQERDGEYELYVVSL